MELQPGAYRRLMALASRTGAASYVETVRAALLMYEALLDQRDKGRAFFTVDDEGEAREFPVVLGP